MFKNHTEKEISAPFLAVAFWYVLEIFKKNVCVCVFIHAFIFI